MLLMCRDMCRADYLSTNVQNESSKKVENVTMNKASINNFGNINVLLQTLLVKIIHDVLELYLTFKGLSYK